MLVHLLTLICLGISNILSLLGSFSPFFSFFPSVIIMSVQQDIADILGNTDSIEQKSATEIIQLALREVTNVLTATGDSLSDICTRIEKATTRKKLREALRLFNDIMRVFTEALPRDVDDRLAVEA